MAYLSSPLIVAMAGLDASKASQMEQFTNSEQGYSISVPVAWEKIDKVAGILTSWFNSFWLIFPHQAGADVLFEDPTRRSSSLGVTVSPVRVSDITQFGTLEQIGEKLLEAERKKVGWFVQELFKKPALHGHEGHTVGTSERWCLYMNVSQTIKPKDLAEPHF
jgi:hypothetical protein